MHACLLFFSHDVPSGAVAVLPIMDRLAERVAPIRSRQAAANAAVESIERIRKTYPAPSIDETLAS
jgi:hypothetical protein